MQCYTSHIVILQCPLPIIGIHDSFKSLGQLSIVDEGLILEQLMDCHEYTVAPSVGPIVK